MKKISQFFGLFLLLFSTTASYASIPLPQSEGKYFSGKGTKASEQYEARAGMPTYDYGKGIQWGPVHFRPSAEYRMRWTDNVFYQPSGEEKNDIVNSLAGALDAELPLGGGQHLLSAGYGFYHEWFNRFDTQNHTDQRVRGGVKLNYVTFTLDIEDIYERTVSRADTEFTDRIQRDENAFHSLLEVPFATFFLENDITDFNIDYQAPNDAFNHNLFTMYQRIGYDWTPNTQVLAEYAYININYDNVGDRDGNGNQFMLGFRGNLTELIAYQIWGGAQYRIYDEDTRPDFNGFVTRGALQYQPTEHSTWILKGDRTPQESTFDNQSYYIRNRLDLTWRRQVHERIFWSSHARVDYDEYSRITKVVSTSEEETRRDYLWGAGTGLEYKMPNDIVSLIVEWNYVLRESNLDGLDYEANEISAGVRAAF